MNVCDRYLGFVSEYVEGSLSGSQRKTFETHLQDCPVCGSRVRQMRTLLQHLKSLPRIKASADFDTVLRARIGIERRLQRQGFAGWFGMWPVRVSFYGAAAALVIIAAVLVRQQLTGSDRSEVRSEMLGAPAAVLEQSVPAPALVFPRDLVSPAPIGSSGRSAAVKQRTEPINDTTAAQQPGKPFEGKIQPVHVRM